MAASVKNAVVPANTEATLGTQRLLLGFDTKRRLDDGPELHGLFLRTWGRTPGFVARYFGSLQRDADHKDERPRKLWHPGELRRFHAAVEEGHAVDYVAVYNEPGQHRLARYLVELAADGKTETRIAVDPATARANGHSDARSVRRDVAAALQFRDANGSELLAPASRELLVFLDVEWKTPLHAFYWLGWAEGIIDRKTIPIPGVKLLPALYTPRSYEASPAGSTAAAHMNPEALGSVDKAFPPDPPEEWQADAHRCFAVTGLAGDGCPGPEAALEMHGVRGEWPASFINLVLPDRSEAPVVLWQYGMNRELVRDGCMALVSAAPGQPQVECAGVPTGHYDLEVAITKTGPLGVSEFQYTVKGYGGLDTTSDGLPTTAAGYGISGAGIGLSFAAGTYTQGSTYRWSSEAKIFELGRAPRLAVADLDFVMAAPDGYKGRPVTDFMLRREGAER